MIKQMSFMDMLSIFCFYLTVITMDDNKMLEEHLIEQDNKINKILEVLENDNR